MAEGGAEEATFGSERLTEAQIRVRDAAYDAAVASAPLRIAPGTVSGNGVAVAGTDGFLFIANGANQWERQYLERSPVPVSWLDGWTTLLSGRAEQAARRGIALWNVVAPEKQVVLPERRWLAPMPDGGNRPLCQLRDALHGEGSLFYLADALIEAKAHAPTYFRTNSHWTPSGCCHALRALLRQAGSITVPADLAFAYAPMMTTQDLPPHFMLQPPLEHAGFLDLVGETMFEHRPFESTGRFTGTHYGVRNGEAPDARRVLIFGDSFSYDTGLSAFMTAVFHDTIFIWSKDVLWSEVDRHRPDIVLWESAERFLATIPRS